MYLTRSLRILVLILVALGGFAIAACAAPASTETSVPAARPTGAPTTAADPTAVLAPATTAATSPAATSVAKAAPAARKVAVVTTISVFADMIKQVGGDRVDVQSLLSAGSDPHTFQATPRDAQVVASADVIAINGLGFDQFVEKLIKSVARPNTRVVVLSEGLTPLKTEDEREDEHKQSGADTHGEANPHLWLDPRHGIRYVERVRDGLVAADPDGRATYTANAERYIGELRALDRDLEKLVETVPADRRKLVTAHDAFPYLAGRYGFEMVGVAMKVPDREPSAQEIAELVRQIKQQRLRALFVEPQLPSRVLDSLARDSGAKICSLYSDALDAKVSTYAALLRFNAQQLVDCLK